MHIKLEFSQNIKRGSLVHTPDFITVNDFGEEEFLSFHNQFVNLQKNGQDVIPIVIDSCGGDVYSLFGMISLMKSAPVPVATIVLGKAFSCGAVLASAGTPGYRFMSEHASILVHQISTADQGKMAEIESSLDHVRKLDKKLLSILDENCGQESGFFSKRIKEIGNVDEYVTPKEAKKLGIIDKIGVPMLKVTVKQTVTLELKDKKKDKL